jgi:hypothetical protein
MLFKKQLWTCIIIAIVLAGCSSDEENPVKPKPKSDPPEFLLREISVPTTMQNNADAKAKEALALIDEAMSFAGSGCVFLPPDGATALVESNTAWEYSWDEGGLTKRLKIDLYTGQRKWQLFLSGSAEGVSYDNWRFMDAGQKTDLTIGHVYLYEHGSSQPMEEWSWHTLGTQDYVLQRQLFVDPIGKIVVTIRPDKSGKIEKYVAGSTSGLVYDKLFTWDASGSGTWRTYNDGQPVDNGSWN